MKLNIIGHENIDLRPVSKVDKNLKQMFIKGLTERKSPGQNVEFNFTEGIIALYPYDHRGISAHYHRNMLHICPCLLP